MITHSDAEAAVGRPTLGRLAHDWLSLPAADQLPFFAWLILHDVPGDRACRYRQRASQVHLPGSTAPREIPILRADHHLVRPGRYSGPGIDARPAAGFNHMGTSLAKDLQVTFAGGVVTRLLRTELNVKLDAIGNSLALLQGIR